MIFLRVLCASDIHADAHAAGRILSIIEKEKVDVYLDAGDIHSPDFAKEFYSQIPIKGFCSPGNADWNLDDQEIGNVTISNYGMFKHKGYHFFLTGMRFPQDYVSDALTLTQDVPPEKLIYLTHIPPLGGLDVMWNGQNMGLAPFRTFDEIKQPLMHVFGHIHEKRGIDSIKDTMLVNCAVSGNGYVYIIDLPSLEVKNIKL